jgi:hypothetical protein
MRPTNLALPTEFAFSPVESRAGGGTALDRWLTVSIFFFLLSQAYLIPVAAVGPSWTLWPRIADVAIGMMALGVALKFLEGFCLPQPLRQILVGLLVFLWLAAMSVLISTILLPRLSHSFPKYDLAFQWGAYHLVRMVQFVLVFCAASLIPISPGTKLWLARVTALVLLVLCVSVVANYLKILPNEIIIGHLPSDKSVAGPWSEFGAEGDGLGTVGYNHAYTAAQVMLAFALYFSLTDQRLSLMSGLLLLASLLAVLLSGSRAGLGAMLVQACVCVLLWISRGYLLPLVWMSVVLGVAATTFVALPGEVLSQTAHRVQTANDQMLARQVTTFRGYKSENLSGRTEIWKSRLKYLNDEPYRWIFGAGFGSAAVSGQNAHMLPLNVVVEVGIIGLLVGSVLCWQIGRQLWQLEPPGRPFFWSSVAILLTCLTQETFYPVPALGHYLGFYLFCLAIVLRLAMSALSTETGPDGLTAEG